MIIRRIFESDDFVLIDKLAGVLTTPSRFEEEDIRLCLGTALQAEMKQQIYPVHRLDFEVSGLVMFAKNAEAHRQSNAWFENKLVQKTYRALTTPQDFSHIPANISNPRITFEPKANETLHWKSQLLRGKKRTYESPQGKPSLTLAAFLGTTKDFLLWDLQPVTGRPHQLRYELSRHGFPIVGDALYGSKVPFGENKIALRSYKIDFSKAPSAKAFGLPPAVEIEAEF
ncbi:RluA family pseudouridine synthase [Bdellovibrio reynosensis]|uniref:RNA pseudouridine synthase n=1 Tax=Bdellovibrio reynosensis TaxID=2835041 RepID=A0ABY4CC14_9BACT|nr:RNA pseudouridine synthase [Bdellovibrio reynosensis]UOF02487.1 RNA pseudouridine synthase [Bdellovibrio reynosensis]